jgi:molybdenum cofactor guanylyltransferase
VTSTLSALILAGGRSRRMGKNKVWLPFEGRPLIEHVALLIAPLASELIISTDATEPFSELARRLPLPMKMALDHFRGAGPLAGLHAGLAVAENDLVLLVAADMPFINLHLIQHFIQLAEGFDATVPLVPVANAASPLPEPLHALYRQSCLSAIEARLNAHQRRLVSFFPDVRTRYVTPAEIAAIDPDFLSFTNLNTPEEWTAAQQHVDAED